MKMGPATVAYSALRAAPLMWPVAAETAIVKIPVCLRSAGCLGGWLAGGACRSGIHQGVPGCLTEVEEDLAKVVRMPGDAEQARVAHGILVVARPESEALRVAHGLDDEADGEHDDAGDVTGGPEGRRRRRRRGGAAHGGRVEHGDGQRDGPDPDHLEDPEAEEGEEAVARAVEAVVLARPQDAEQQEAREARAPGGDEGCGHDLAGVGPAAAAAQGEGHGG